MIKINEEISLKERELEFEFIRASGPGGQNVNKVATAAQLRFNITSSPSLPPEVKSILKKKLAKRLNAKGDLIIKANRYRTQERNRADAIERLRKIFNAALTKRKKRIATKATRSAKEARLKSKKIRGEIKKLRGGKFPDDG